jgi:hypothetical protein
VRRISLAVYMHGVSKEILKLELLAALRPEQWHADARREVLTNYLGFPYWDVLGFPMMSVRETGEFNRDPGRPDQPAGCSRVARIRRIGEPQRHRIRALRRVPVAYRENDYLLGRLHAVDRLIDIVCDCADLDPAHDGIDVPALKKRAFAQILDVEEPHLLHSAELIAALRRRVAEMEPARPS